MAFATALLAGCSVRAGGGPPVEVEWAGLVYRASTRFCTEGPFRIRSVVYAENRGAEPVEADVITGSVYVRLRGPGGWRGLPVWDERSRVERQMSSGSGGFGSGGVGRGDRGREDRMEREAPPVGSRPRETVVIEPGATRWLAITVVQPDVIGDTIPPALYHFSVLAPIGDRVLELRSGSELLGPAREEGANGDHVHGPRAGCDGGPLGVGVGDGGRGSGAAS